MTGHNVSLEALRPRGCAGRPRLRLGVFDVVVDLAVVGPTGWIYLEELCTLCPRLGVVVCTGASSVAQRVRGLRLGADDWVTKPCRREFELLQLLADAEGQVLQRKEIYELVWGYAMARGERSVDIFVRKLRHKLECVSPDWRYIHTHFGVGYRFAAEPVTGSTRSEAIAA
jgi:DNA-binding response OmpR family regulator